MRERRKSNGQLNGSYPSIGPGKDHIPTPAQPAPAAAAPAAAPQAAAPRRNSGPMLSFPANPDRYQGMTVRVASPPSWSRREHREALQASGVRLVAVDVETTGLQVQHGSVTEIGWYDINDGVGGSFIPPHDLTTADPEALAISRYEERIAGQPVDAAQVKHLHWLLGGDGSRVVIVGSNPGFDMAHLNQLFADYGLGQDPWRHRSVDVASAAYWLSEEPVGAPGGLADAAAMYGIDNTSHHDAFADTVVTARLWHSLECRRHEVTAPPF